MMNDDPARVGVAIVVFGLDLRLHLSEDEKRKSFRLPLSSCHAMPRHLLA